jgi:ribosomal protein L18E
MDHLDSHQLRNAAKHYAEASRRFSSAPFWRKKNAGLELKAQRRAYVRELIRTAEARRLEV